MRLTLRSAIFVLIFFLVTVPITLITRYLVYQFEDIQEEEQIQKLSAQAMSTSQHIQFDLALFRSQLDQLSRDSGTILASYTGTFAERARTKMDLLVRDQSIVGALLLVDKKKWTLSSSPIQAELIDYSSIHPFYDALFKEGIQARPQYHIIEDKQLAHDLRIRTSQNEKEVLEDKILVLISPLILSDTRYADEFSVLAGALVALIPMENIFFELDNDKKNMHLTALSMGQNSLNSERKFSKTKFIEVTSSLTIDGFNTPLEARFARSREEAFLPVDRLTTQFMWIIGIFIALLSGLAVIASRWLIKPITALNKLVERYLARNYTPVNQDTNFTEIQNIVDVLAHMASQIQKDHQELENRVKARTADLEEANSELSEAMEKLKIAQDQLIEKEKLSLLGQLVAGIAHEINTPLGICVTAGTSLEDDLKTLQDAYKNNTISKKSLENFFRTFDDGFTIILNNINRSAALIQNFKAMAVDSSSEQKRSFLLKQYIEETIYSLQPELRKYNAKIHVDGDNSLILNSYPGAYAQILTNLIINSLRHGFNQEDPHTINISFSLEGKTLVFIYKDDGKGVDHTRLERLFEPFYTTLSNQGGSGLGLNIIHNLITNTLGGTVEVESEIGEGIEFTFYIPLTVEH